MTGLEKIGRLEEAYFVGRLTSLQTSSIAKEEYAQKLLPLILDLLFDHPDCQLLQLDKEEFRSMKDWDRDTILETLYLSLISLAPPTYCYLEDSDSLLILDDQTSCPIFSTNKEWITALNELAQAYALSFQTENAL